MLERRDGEAERAQTPALGPKCAEAKIAASAVGRGLGDDPVVGPGKSQHVTSHFLDEIRVRRIGAHQGHVARKRGAHSLKALDFELQSVFTLQQCIPRLEAVTAMQGVIGEIGRQT